MSEKIPNSENMTREEMENAYIKVIEELKAEISRNNADKSRFLFNLSHDFRTPMTAIMGFTSIAKKYSDDQSKVVDCLSKIEVSGEHLLQLLNDCIDMAEISSGKVVLEETPSNINEMVSFLITMASEEAEKKNIELTYELRNIKNSDVYADPLRASQIAMNPLQNAIKYSKNGGNVKVCVTQLDCEEEGFAKYCLEIVDEGIGMSEEFVNKIFDEFSRESSPENNELEGTGLGMTVTKRLMELMGGSIDVKSKKGEGTTVSMYMKFKTVSQRADYSKYDDEKTSQILFGKHGLLVEDNDLNREIAVSILSDEGVFIDEASDGQEAVDIVKASEPGYYDFILMDIQLKEMDGYEATQLIRALDDEKLANIPIVAMTANSFDEDKKKAKSVGMNDFITKPISVSKLFETLCNVLN